MGQLYVTSLIGRRQRNFCSAVQSRGSKPEGKELVEQGNPALALYLRQLGDWREEEEGAESTDRQTDTERERREEGRKEGEREGRKERGEERESRA
ncbi:hypothetical protein chiPu_0004499 [Chiloscyllium punctatum]|uniref:Uncharacterized protein n=1 Tax=Chiloscyllium punctatum TaxID=137246 RepID=A0A401S6R3_CHIPU|nr:hypothetical protein [Chiloscyllium punctatum]